MALNKSAAQYSGTGAPTSLAGQVSDQYHDTSSAGSLYICTVAGSPGTWQQVSGGGGGGFTGYANYTIDLDVQGGPYSIPNNLPAEIVFTIVTGGGTGAVALPNYTMETQQTYLPLTIVNSPTSLLPFNLNTSPTTVLYPGQSVLLYPTNYAVSGGGLQVLNGAPINSQLSSNNLYVGDNGPTPGIGNNNTTFGENAGTHLGNSAAFNTLVGQGAGGGSGLAAQNRVTAIGQAAAASAGASNLIAIGPGALNNVAADYNIGIGDSTFTGGCGVHNVGVGYNVGVGCNNTGVVYNTFVGSAAGTSQNSYSGCTYLGYLADSTVNSLVNSISIGYNTKISVSNAANFGNGALTAIGVNNLSPAEGFDPDISGSASTVWAYKFPVSTLPATTAKGNLWMNGSDQLSFTNPSGVTTILGAGSIPSFTGIAYNTAGTLSQATVAEVATGAAIVPAVAQTILANGGVTMTALSPQHLYVGVISASPTPYIILPDPTVTDSPASQFRPYFISVAVTDGTNNYQSMIVYDSDGTTRTADLAGVNVTMSPGDTWMLFWSGTALVWTGVLVGNNNYPTNASGCLQGQWYSTTNDPGITTMQNYWSWQIINNNTVVYVIPGYSTPTTIAGSFCFRTISSGAFPAYAFPAAVPSWPLTVWDGGVLKFGQVVIDGTALSNQILVNADTSGGNFSALGAGSALIPPTTITKFLP